MAEKKKKESKRYYWFKLYDDFFNSNRIKKLRKIAGGDTYTIIYLKMQLKALKQDGYLYFNGYFGDFYEELALDIDEDSTNVRITCEYLLSVGLLEVNEDGKQYYLSYLKNCIGSETASAQRVRDHRQRKKEAQEALQCNETVTKALQCNIKTLQSNTDVTKCNDAVTEVLRNGNAEIDTRYKTQEYLSIDRKPQENIINKYSPKELKQLTIQIRDSWNTLKPLGIQELIVLDVGISQRGHDLIDRLNEFGIESFEQIVEEIKASDYLLGKDNKNRPVRFEWVVESSENYEKVRTGYYRTWPAAETKEHSESSKAINWHPHESEYKDTDFEELEKQLVEN